ncbi:FHA domain-containing protein [Enemella evansiae]|uniref:FHA domain-containing protein n=1 Tax=Enemella evansiae TaxID=2016499 RepID=UPI00105B3B2D|nr:FHA domain-containing protein [Enemella evansiae]TDO92941.1 zinc ribbon protein [Enemella evansiae]
MPYCTKCGHNNPEGSNYCSQCGEPQVRTEHIRVELDQTAAGSDTTKVIPSVGEENPAAGELSAEDEAAVGSLPEGHALLIVNRGPSAGARFLLDSDEATAGRHPDSDIFLDDITVSRHHVRFTRTDEGTTVADVGSLNGTYVNRTLIDGEVLLKPGDEVQIGKFRMVYFAKPARASD